MKAAAWLPLGEHDGALRFLIVVRLERCAAWRDEDRLLFQAAARLVSRALEHRAYLRHVEVAARRGGFRTNDGVYRAGGDEFAVLLHGATALSEDDVYERVDVAVAVMRSASFGGTSPSLGVATRQGGNGQHRGAPGRRAHVPHEAAAQGAAGGAGLRSALWCNEGPSSCRPGMDSKTPLVTPSQLTPSPAELYQSRGRG